MEIQLAILVLSFVVLLVLGVPIAVAIGLSAVLTIFSLGDVPTTYIVAQRMSTGIASFPLLAIPFFILAGLLMGEGGMARRLVDLASVLVGRYQGGLSYVTTLTCMMFGAISGSATAAVSSVGGMMIPEMTRNGYEKNYSVALATAAATTGLVIPPSNIMIVFAVVAGDISAQDIKATAANSSDGFVHLETLSGDALSAQVRGNNVFVFDENGNAAKITIADVDQSNGVIHVVNKVLLPK